MAIIQQIQQKTGCLFLVILGSLLLFVISDLIKSDRGGIFGGGGLSVGEIKGDKISYEEFNTRLNTMLQQLEQNNPGTKIDETIRAQYSEQAWNSFLQDKIFARIITFGKGLGCHGAAILGSQNLKDYLINFARSFIYTTGLSPHSVATILTAYHQLDTEKEAIQKLRGNIIHFNQEKNLLGIKPLFVRSKSAIQSAIIPGNGKVKSIANQLQEKGFNVKAILSPTVPEGQERLRICLHSYNSVKEISDVLNLLSNFVF